MTVIGEYTREWLANLGVKTLFIEPGSPWDIGFPGRAWEPGTQRSQTIS